MNTHFSGDIKTTPQELCETKSDFSKWMNGKVLSILEVSNGVNESNSKDQCDKKCGFFGTRDVSKITKSNCSMFTYVLRGVLIPSVGILGLIGNTLSIIVFNRPEMKIWKFNGSYEMTRTSFLLISKKYFIKDKRQST